MQSLPFYIPKAGKRYPFRAEPPRIGHYREYPPPPWGHRRSAIHKSPVRFSAIATVYLEEGNKEYRRKDASNAVSFYTQGIQVNCKDDVLNAKLYSNRATAHFSLGKTLFHVLNFEQSFCLLIENIK